MLCVSALGETGSARTYRGGWGVQGGVVGNAVRWMIAQSECIPREKEFVVGENYILEKHLE